jgi:hypothetical protein
MSNYSLAVMVLSDAVNSPVIHFPGRQFPGVLVQGDSLKSMASLAAEIGTHLSVGDLEEARSAADDLAERLGSHVKLYENTLKAYGLTLPYPSAR